MDLVKKLPETKSQKNLAVPFFILITKRCVQNKIDPYLVQHLHFYDLQCLLLQLEIDKIVQYLEAEEREKLKARGIKKVTPISGNEALKLLGR